MKKVILESPYAGNVEANIKYARACVRDSLLRGEAPIASHLLYTQEGILRDDIPEERNQGIHAGLAWKEVADLHVFYVDLGISRGMEYGMDFVTENKIPFEIRRIANSDNESVKKYFGELMAVMHRDGGHYLAKHGSKIAFEEALKNYYKLVDKSHQTKEYIMGTHDPKSMVEEVKKFEVARSRVIDSFGTLSRTIERVTITFSPVLSKNVIASKEVESECDSSSSDFDDLINLIEERINVFNKALNTICDHSCV